MTDHQPHDTRAPRPRRLSRRTGSRLLLALAAALVATAGGLLADPPINAATKATPVPVGDYTITTGSTSGLTDGQPIPVSVTSSDPKLAPVGWVDIQICKPGPNYDDFSKVDQVAKHGNCGYSPGSSAYSSPNGAAQKDGPGQPDGTSNFPTQLIAGIGTATFSSGGVTGTLTCDSTDPCDMVVSVFTSQENFELYPPKPALVQSYTMTFVPFGSLNGCNGISPDAIQTVGPDRLAVAYPQWSKQACSGAGPGGGAAPTQNTFLNEGGPFSAVDSFANGSADLAYAAGGYGLPGFAEPTGRPYVAVPIALNALVVAASGGQTVPAYTPPRSAPATTLQPFSNLEVTAGEAASLFGGGYLTTGGTADLINNNPSLAAAGELVPFNNGANTFIYPEEVAGTNATTVFASSFFTDTEGPYWNTGPHPVPGAHAYQPRGIISSFAQPGTEPQFTSGSQYSARTDLEKSVLPYLGSVGDPLWVLTDRATATELGLSIASLGSDTDQFVAATPATMDAAVATMVAKPDGTLTPSPTATIAGSSSYPLTFVEYALAPTEPLVTTACAPRTASEQTLVSWLEFLTGAGQTNMAPGLEPLTPGLLAQAKAAIAKIGTAPQTGSCAPGTPNPVTGTTKPTTSTTTPSTSSSTAPASGAGSAGAGAGGSVPPSSFGSLGGVPVPAAPSSSSSLSPGGTQAGSSGPSTRPGSSSSSPTEKVPTKLAVAIPPYGGRSTGGVLYPALGLAILGLLLGATALRTSGWWPAGLAGVQRLLGRFGGRR